MRMAGMGGLATSGDGGLQQGTRLLEARGVFGDDFIDSTIDLTMTEVISFKRTPYGSRCTIRGNVLPTPYAG
jgi:hypothetical protein